jgi:hypothetical protein
MARPSQVIAGERVERARPEEESANHEEGDVEHGTTPGYGITAYKTEAIRPTIEPSLEAR